MNESTTITIDNIAKLIKGIAEGEYQRGYVAGLEEKRLTEKHWGKNKEDKTELNNIIKNAHGSIENRINAAYNLGKKEGMSKWIPVTERLPKDHDWYLVVVREKSTGYQYIPRVASHLSGNDWCLIDTEDANKEWLADLECIAWTFIPEPYREDGTE